MRGEDYGLSDPPPPLLDGIFTFLRFLLQFVPPPPQEKSIFFLFSVLETCHESFQLKSFCLGVGGFSLFSLQFPEWAHSYFPPYLSLFCLICPPPTPPLAFKHDPAARALLYEV